MKRTKQHVHVVMDFMTNRILGVYANITYACEKYNKEAGKFKPSKKFKTPADRFGLLEFSVEGTELRHGTVLDYITARPA